MTPGNYQYLCNFLQRRAGLVLSADKTYLAESRLSPVARRLGLSSLDAMAEALKGGTAPTLELAVVEAMVTNETSFFRDKVPFQQLRSTVIPALIASRATQQRINIWCAAASTGQEPYSIAMLLKEFENELRGWRIDILGTDIAPGVLEKAKSGVYSQFEIQRGLPIKELIRHFTQEDETWRISGDLRGMVRFREFNLLDDFIGLGHFDIVFCRNVLMYFDRETKADILDRVAHTLTPDGYLVLGAAETIIGLTESLAPVPEERGLFAPARGALGKPMPRAAAG
jgi:chemotaxis protein methyltransferase CheR